MKLSDKLKQHKDLIEDKLRGSLYKIHEGPAGGIVFMQHPDGTFVECWIEDESKKMDWNKAREYVKTLNRGGYSDWSLPTKEELDELYINKNQIGNFQNDYYWSDSDFERFYAWNQDFSAGFPNYNYKKFNDYRVRAIRRFK